MSPKPTVLFVHGSWHTPAHFERVRRVFEEAGYETKCPQQPSVGNLPPVSMMDDAKCITDELARLVETEGKDVAVVAHSYGGIVATEGVQGRFNKAARAQAGQTGGVLRIIYIAAFLVTVGSNLCDPLGGTIPPFIPVDVSKWPYACGKHMGQRLCASYQLLQQLSHNLHNQSTNETLHPGSTDVHHEQPPENVLS